MTTMLQATTVFQPSPMTAGTPIILAPRIQTPQQLQPVANVTSLQSQAVLASHTPPSVVTPPANAATAPQTSGLVYSYDTAAYLQRMLEYSTTGVDPSAVGKCLPALIPMFTARRHASAVYAVVVCLSVCLSQVGVLLKWLNVGSYRQRHTIA